ncbi:site-specific integrase [Tsukamurella ocularis]|uniref:site-specific integrase n=1 Tax=Tsukamurella ocularis TaxID=1970234 RepID=UPI0039EEDBCF
MARPPLPLGTWGEITRAQTASGQWRARAKYRDWDGRTRTVERFGASGAKAEAALKIALRDRARPAAAPADVTRDTNLADLGAIWLDTKRRQNLAPKTIELYEQTIRTHVTPAVGELRVGEVTIGGLERFLDTKAGTVKKRCRLALSGMMGIAAKHDAADRNLVRDTTPAAVQRKKPRAISAAELTILRARVAAYAGTHGGDGKPTGPPRAVDLPELFEVFIGTGGRINEVLPLAWSDVLWDSKQVVLNRTKGGENMLVLTLPQFAIDALKAQRARMLPGDLVFPSRAGTARLAANVRRQLREARKHVVRDARGTADGPAGMFEWVTPHSFRRTVATVLAEELGEERAAGQLGHSGPDVTRAHYIERKAVAPDSSVELQRRLAPSPPFTHPK